MRNWIGGNLLLFVLPLASSFTLLPSFYHHVSGIIVVIIVIKIIVVIVVIVVIMLGHHVGYLTTYHCPS